nr:lyase family protein [Sphingomonas sp. BT553]
MLEVWSDAATIRHALAFEAALAEAQGAEGLIAADVATRIAAVARALTIDPVMLAEEVALAGTMAIPLVRHLRAAMGDDGGQVHGGATSQDVADTVLVLQLRDAAALLIADAARITRALKVHAVAHADRPAVGRTLLQDALPIGFGLRIAQWRAGIAAAAAQVEAAAAGLTLQLGGAAGTRCGMAGRGEAVAGRMAATLGIAAGPPWHARRTATAMVASAVGILIGATAKMARDISLLAQNAIGEVREPVIAGRGGSSAMAHKRNPTGCQVTLAAATRASGLVAGVLAAMAGEEERGLGGWQAEGPMLADLALIASGALAAMAVVAEGLEIDEAAIARNLASAGIGDDIGESVALVAALLKEDG